MHPRVASVREGMAPDSYRAVAALGPSGGVEEDRVLFDAIVSGDARLADSIYRRLVPPIDSTLRRLFGGRRRDHEELVERSLKRVIFEVSRHPQPWVCSLATWAHARAAQVALDSLRVNDRPAAASEASLHDSLRNGAVEAAPTKGVAQLRTLLAELAPAQAEVLVLHHLLGLGLSHVAITTGASLQAVEHRLAHGRQRLAARLEERRILATSALQPA